MSWVHTRRHGGKKAFFGKVALHLDLHYSSRGVGSEVTVVTIQAV
jgi:hypothetical protein